MNKDQHPTYGNGKICYLEVPTTDAELSALFYEQVFGWKTRKDNHGNISFDDGVGEVSGTWINGIKPANEGGIVISIMVYNIIETMQLILKNGGKITMSPDINSSEKIARFLDPYGNLFGLYQHNDH